MVIVGLSKKKNNKMNDNQGFMVDENLIERKKRLEEELDNKLSNDYQEFINKSNEYLQKTKENTKRYYQDLLSKELDSMENAINSGNTLQAMSHRLTANVYESIIQNL
jgi:6-pyruvoyl-tetrahydropterin synthase